MIKETLVMVAFGATFVEKTHQPDLPHKYYSPIAEPSNGVRAYGNIQIGQITNSKTQSYFIATLVTKHI